MKDAPVLASLHRTGFAAAWDETEFERLLCEKGHLAHGLYVNRSRTPCGFVLSRFVADEGEILTMILDKAVRRKGFSRSLLNTHLEKLDHLGVTHIHLEVDKGNAPALALYHSCGFSISGERKAYYAKPDGSRADALMMTIRL